MSDLKFWLGFNLVKGIGPARFQALSGHFGDLERAWFASEAELVKLGFDPRTLASFREARSSLDLDRCLARVQRAGISLTTWDSADYPSYLKEIPSPPFLLYSRGRLEEIDRFAVAVVGTRRLTNYGRQVTRELVTGLVQNGVTIVSGLAKGIDAIAHATALDLGGRTIAVLGSGLDQIYPPENKNLARRILEEKRGALISEYGLGVMPDAGNFPPRNRIISGLSLGVVVIEAGVRSGALISARYALEQDRDVFAVPGNIISYASKGTNRLIQDGAKLVTGAADVLEELNLKMVFEQAAVQLALPETAEEAAIIAHLSAQPVHVDELSRTTGLPSSLLSSTLTLMELKGMVQQVGGMNYALIREAGPGYEIINTKE